MFLQKRRPRRRGRCLFLHLIIVEDLPLDRERLADLIRRDCDGHGERAELSFYESGEAFLEGYRPGFCDGLFLDIVLDGLTGMEAARRVREREPRLPIIFTTTRRDYAVDGFAVHATDYLVKPVAQDRVSWCMDQLRESLAEPPSLSLLETSGRGHSAPVDVPLDDIRYAQCFDHIIQVSTVSGVYRTRCSFQDFTAQLPRTGRFCVCGRGLVVNLSHVTRVLDRELLLKSGDRLPFSRNRRQDIQRAYTAWAAARARKGGWAR